VLTITGTDDADRISVRLKTDKTTGDQTLVVREHTHTADDTDEEEPVVTEFTDDELATITRIVVNAGAGNDSVELGHGRKGAALSIASEINGGDGNDRLAGAGGADVINGGAGDDFIDGAAGDDNLSGESGNDRINGGKGADNMSGGDGNDVINAADGEGTDTIDGGAPDAPTGTTTTTTTGKFGKRKIGLAKDADVAIVDEGDTATGIEYTYDAPVKGPGHGKGPGGPGHGPKGRH
jgi:Ca2+-binding RTX toxin-like protein